MILQLELLEGPDIIQCAAGQDDLPSSWVGHTLLSLAHDAVEELAGLVHLSKVTYSLGADMVVVDLAAVLTAELAQGVPVPALLPAVPDLLLLHHIRVVQGVGLWRSQAWLVAVVPGIGSVGMAI